MAADREHSIDQCSILMEAAANQGVWKLYCGGGPPLSAATAGTALKQSRLPSGRQASAWSARLPVVRRRRLGYLASSNDPAANDCE